MQDFKKEFGSVEELEDLLNDEFATETEEGDETEDETEDVEGDDETDDDETDEEQDDDETDKEQDDDDDDENEEQTLTNFKTKKATGDEVFEEDKKNFTFKKLREEAQEYKRKMQEVEPLIQEYDTLAKSYGYRDAKHMAEEIKKKKILEEAKSKGVDPELYLRTQELEREIAEIKKERIVQEQQLRTERFVKELETFVKDNNLSDVEKTKILNEMDADGWTIEQITSVKNPKNVLKGYASDIILERKKQQELSQQKKKKVVEKEFSNQSTKTKTVDDIVEEDLKKYAKEQGYLK